MSKITKIDFDEERQMINVATDFDELRVFLFPIKEIKDKLDLKLKVEEQITKLKQAKGSIGNLKELEGEELNV